MLLAVPVSGLPFAVPSCVTPSCVQATHVRPGSFVFFHTISVPPLELLEEELEEVAAVSTVQEASISL